MKRRRAGATQARDGVLTSSSEVSEHVDESVTVQGTYTVQDLGGHTMMVDDGKGGWRPVKRIAHVKLADGGSSSSERRPDGELADARRQGRRSLRSPVPAGGDGGHGDGGARDPLPTLTDISARRGRRPADGSRPAGGVRARGGAAISAHRSRKATAPRLAGANAPSGARSTPIRSTAATLGTCGGQQLRPRRGAASAATCAVHGAAAVDHRDERQHDRRVVDRRRGTRRAGRACAPTASSGSSARAARRRRRTRPRSSA